MVRSIYLLFLITVSTWLPSVASAAIVTFNYTATGLNTAPGTTVTGQFGWDDAVADSEPSDEQGVYPSAGFWSGVISGGSQNGADFNLSGLDVTIRENAPTGAPGEIIDNIEIRVSTDSFIEINDETATVFSSDALPATINLAAFSSESGFSLINADIGLPPDPGIQRSYQFTSVTPVPVPAAVWLFGSGLLGLLGISRQKRSVECFHYDGVTGADSSNQ